MADNPPETPNRYILFTKVFWKTITIIAVPIICLPILFVKYTPPYRCLYIVAILAIFWVTEALPLPVTSLIPIVAFPVFDLEPTGAICTQYFKGAVVLLWAALVIALAIENCNLHKRVALRTILCVGCSLRRLLIGFAIVTCCVSLFLANTASAVMMCPIIMAVLEELEGQKLCKIYEDLDPNLGTDQIRRPTRVTKAFYTTIAFSASIGGIGTIIGSGTNLATKGVFETRFPNGPQIDFVRWLIYGIPIAIVVAVAMVLWIQIIFMGLFRPHSKDAENVSIGKEGEQLARQIIAERFHSLGKMSNHEILVLIMLLLLVVLCFTRDPTIFPGWAILFSDKKISDSTPGVLVVILCFMLPATCNIKKFFSKAEEDPKFESPPLVPWSNVQKKLPWGVIFLLGGGFAVSKAGNDSGMAKMIGTSLARLGNFPEWAMTAIMVALTETLTEFAANVAIANIILPIVLETAVASGMNPLLFIYPVGIACSFAMLTPVSTPANAIVTGYVNLRTTDLIIAGIGPKLTSIIVLVFLTPLIGHVVYPEVGELPDWAKENETESGLFLDY